MATSEEMVAYVTYLRRILDRSKPKILGPRKAGESTCEVCRKLHIIIRSTERGAPWFELGPRDRLLQSECEFHSPILRYALNVESEPHQRLRLVRTPEEPDVMVFAQGGRGDTSLRITAGGSYDSWFQLVRNAQKKALQGAGRLINTQWIDTNLLRRWKEHCQTSHTKCRQTPAMQAIYTGRPSLLIDTWRMRLADAPPEASYVALSYVWGNVSTFRTIKQNLADLQVDQALLHLLQTSKLPTTIGHAIQLVITLKERYLWVDTLCIVQDDDESKHEQINAMASIYFNSLLTIIAAEGDDVQHGITGLRGISQPRTCSQRIFNLHRTGQLIYVPVPFLARRRWFRRGWTFQEHLFSHRRLVFGDYRVRWECKEEDWQEDVEYNVSPSASPYASGEESMELQMENFCWPNLSYYMKIVSHYNKREFTYAKDAYFAWAGLLSLIDSSYEGGFLYGLPAMFFDDAMLWQPARTLKRRFARPPSPQSPPDFQLPSWSWMGWRGEIDSWSSSSANEFVKEYSDSLRRCQTSVRTISTVEWHYVSNQADGERRPIRVTCKKYAPSSDSQPLPLGWTKHDFDWNEMDFHDKNMWPEKRSVQHIYKYKDDSHSEFWYPVPVSSNQPLQEAQPPGPGACLFCETTRASFFAVRDMKCYPPGASLRDADGMWVGYLTFHDKKDQKRLPSRRNKSVVPAVFDLVAISAGYVRNDGEARELEEFELEERPKSSPYYEFYNVLWVVWDQGIAQRRGLGRVMKSAWEAEERDHIDLVLG